MTPSLSSVAIVGGGPGGLFLASLLKRQRPELEVTLYERNQRTDAFGFGVVFSDATLRNVDAADPVLRNALRDRGRHWDRIDVWSKGEEHGFAGNGMAAIHRKILLQELQRNAEESGARLLFGSEAPPLEELRRDHDVVVGADGTNSAVRRQLEAEVDLGHEIEVASAKFIWFGTTHLFDGLTFVHRVSEHGNFAVHGYPISDELSTFIVETDEDTWRRSGLDAFDVDQPPGPSDTATQRYLEELFAEDIPGAHLVANNSRWANFRTRRTRRWTHGTVALLGDAVHTAHFSVGSGTKMAMEDAVALAGQLTAVAGGERDLPSAMAAYEEERQPSVDRIQSAARPSLAWWEHFGEYQQAFDPLTFTFHFFSRSITIDKIAQRDPELAAQVREAWLAQHGAPALETTVEAKGGARLSRSLTLGEVSGRTATIGDGDGALEVPVVVVDEDAPSTVPIDELPSAGAVLVSGGPGRQRNLVSEEARLRRGLTTIVTGPDLVDPAAGETLILSGRADAVAVPAPVGVAR